MTDWAYVDGETLHINWAEVFDHANYYDAGDTSFDAQLGKLISMIHRGAFERGFESGCKTTHPKEILLAYTMGNA
jgi:hypothetical protein